jgi:hypothetical protein
LSRRYNAQMASQVCRFCNNVPAQWSNEHIFPEWLMSYLNVPEGDLLYQGYATADTGEPLKAPRIHATSNFVDGRVCSTCNNGWMSALENEAKPILIPLIEGKRLVQNLTMAERQTVAKWATKTASLISCVSLASKPVSANHLHALNTPAGLPAVAVGVLAVQWSFTTAASILQRDYWPQISVTSSPEPSPTSPPDAYKLGVQFKHLYLCVIYWPGSDPRYALAAGLHVPIWPATALLWPSYLPQVPPQEDSVGWLRLFVETVAIVHAPPDSKSRGRLTQPNGLAEP